MHKKIAGIALVLAFIALIAGYVLMQVEDKPVVITPAEMAPSPHAPAREKTSEILSEAVAGASSIRAMILNRTVENSDGSTHTYKNGFAALSEDEYGSRPYLEIKEETITVGNADGDDMPDAFVIERYNAGGTGNWYSLLYFEDIEQKQATVVHTELDGDVSVVNSITVKEGSVVLDIYYRGQGDPNCCGTYHREDTYMIEGGAVTKAFSKELGRRPE